MGDLLLAIFVEEDNLPAGGDGRGETAANFLPPDDLQFRRKFIHGGSIGGGVAVPLRSEPLGPIARAGRIRQPVRHHDSAEEKTKQAGHELTGVRFKRWRNTATFPPKTGAQASKKHLAV
jgi:hypothetical protein